MQGQRQRPSLQKTGKGQGLSSFNHILFEKKTCIVHGNSMNRQPENQMIIKAGRAAYNC